MLFNKKDDLLRQTQKMTSEEVIEAYARLNLYQKAGLLRLLLRDVIFGNKNEQISGLQYTDIDVDGAILLIDKKMFFGATAINLICTKIKDPSDSLLGLLKVVFTNSSRSKALFPILLIARRISLFFKGKPKKINF